MARSRAEARKLRSRRIRRKIKGTPERPRLAVFRSGKHIYAQVIDDLSGQTLVAASTLSKDLAESRKAGGNKEGAAEVGKMVAAKAKAAGINNVVFDRAGFRFHGRIKALADAARETGLEF